MFKLNNYWCAKAECAMHTKTESEKITEWSECQKDISLMLARLCVSVC